MDAALKRLRSAPRSKVAFDGTIVCTNMGRTVAVGGKPYAYREGLFTRRGAVYARYLSPPVRKGCMSRVKRGGVLAARTRRGPFTIIGVIENVVCVSKGSAGRSDVYTLRIGRHATTGRECSSRASPYRFYQGVLRVLGEGRRRIRTPTGVHHRAVVV
jgi:hypothetical protein